MLTRGLVLAVALLMPVGTAGAATITNLVTFTANSFVDQNLTPGIAPVDPVTGSFTITFDPTVDATNQTAGITLGSLNLSLGSALSYNYDSATDRLEVGGLSNGANALFFNPPQNDFWLFIDNFLSGTPLFDQVGYAQVSAGSNVYFTLNQTGSVTVTPVPLPATLPLLAGGLGLIAFLRRRRQSRGDAL